MTSMSDKRIIAVLGMHRSGTSALTRALVAIGANAGDNLLPAGADNPKGFWEDKDFVLMNERILATLDATYDSLKLLPANFETDPALGELLLEATLLLRGKVESCQLLTLKDPRTCRLLPFWQRVFEHLQLRVDYLIAVRNPLSVAQSLKHRNGFSERKSHWLWLEHYAGAVTATSGAHRLFVDYDTLLAQPESQLQRLAAGFALNGEPAAVREYIETFLSQDLRHASFEAHDLDIAPHVPDSVRHAYALLRQCCSDEQASIMPTFAPAWAALVDELEQCRPMLDILDEFDRRATGAEQLCVQLQKETEQLSARLQQETERLNTALVTADKENRRLSEAMHDSLNRLATSQAQLRELKALQQGQAQQLELVMNSYSLRITAPLRKVAAAARTLTDRSTRLLRYVTGHPGSIPNAFLHIKRNGLRAGLRRLQEVASPEAVAVLPIHQGVRFDMKTAGEAYILTTRHCLFVAELIARQLNKAGIHAHIITEKPARGFARAPHFVICPQMFSELPELYVAFQMEQTVSSRWLTKRYNELLEHAFAVFDYSQVNLGYFTNHGLSYRQMYFMPVGYLGNYSQAALPEQEYDVLFYGDATCPRRQRFIACIEQKYRVKVIGDLFGEALYAELRKARVIINIHYYEGALLETTRLYECLSLDCLIVSESSVDIEQHQNLQGIVDFVAIDDANAMVERLDYWLADDARRQARISTNRERLNQQPNWFEFYFQRFLLATENIDFDTFYNLAGHNVQFSSDFVCLGLPESVDRRKNFEADNHYGIEYFPGLRHALGWVGCGMSYKFIMRKAKEQGLAQITVCEDDVDFLPGWKEKFQTIKAYLTEHNESWDVFSGFIADLNANTRVLDIAEIDELEIAHIDHMVSAVLNVYNSGFYDAILRWDETNHDVHSNAIDRYMESHEHIRVLTVHPFLVGHKEEQHSTLWGFHNSRYNSLIERSEQMLGQLIDDYRHSQTQA